VLVNPRISLIVKEMFFSCKPVWLLQEPVVSALFLGIGLAFVLCDGRQVGHIVIRVDLCLLLKDTFLHVL
jgi:hypothetical protein